MYILYIYLYIKLFCTCLFWLIVLYFCSFFLEAKKKDAVLAVSEFSQRFVETLNSEYVGLPNYYYYYYYYFHV